MQDGNCRQCTGLTRRLPNKTFKGGVVIAPASATDSPWMKRFAPYAIGICSGWMQVRGHVRRSNADAGFALSDHADWNGLLQTMKDTGAQKVFVTHGFQSAFSRYVSELGIEAAEVKTEFGNDEEAGGERGFEIRDLNLRIWNVARILEWFIV